MGRTKALRMYVARRQGKDQVWGNSVDAQVSSRPQDAYLQDSARDFRPKGVVVLSPGDNWFHFTHNVKKKLHLREVTGIYLWANATRVESFDQLSDGCELIVDGPSIKGKLYDPAPPSESRQSSRAHTPRTRTTSESPMERPPERPRSMMSMTSKPSTQGWMSERGRPRSAPPAKDGAATARESFKELIGTPGTHWPETSPSRRRAKPLSAHRPMPPRPLSARNLARLEAPAAGVVKPSDISGMEKNWRESPRVSTPPPDEYPNRETGHRKHRSAMAPRPKSSKTKVKSRPTGQAALIGAPPNASNRGSISTPGVTSPRRRSLSFAERVKRMRKKVPKVRKYRYHSPSKLVNAPRNVIGLYFSSPERRLRREINGEEDDDIARSETEAESESDSDKEVGMSGVKTTESANDHRKRNQRMSTVSVNMVEAHSPVQHQRAPDFEASKQLGHDAVRSDQWGASEFASDHYEASSSFASTHLLGADPGASLYTPGSRIPSVGSSHRYESRAGNGTSPDSGMERSIQPGAPEGLSQNLGFADTEPRGDGPLEWDVRRERAPPPPSLKHEAAGRRRTRPRKSGGTRRRSTTEAGAVEAARSTGQARLPSPRRRTSEVVMEVQEDILKQVEAMKAAGPLEADRKRKLRAKQLVWRVGGGYLLHPRDDSADVELAARDMELDNDSATILSSHWDGWEMLLLNDEDDDVIGEDFKAMVWEGTEISRSEIIDINTQDMLSAVLKQSCSVLDIDWRHLWTIDRVAKDFTPVKSTYGSLREVVLDVQDAVHTMNQEKELYDTFRQLDISDSGAVNFFEFSSAMENILHLNVPEKYQQELFAFFDTDNSGVVDFGEFLTIIKQGKLPGLVNTHVKRADHEVHLEEMVFVTDRVRLWHRNDFYDRRMASPYNVEEIMIPNEAAWQNWLAELQWTKPGRLRQVQEFLQYKVLSSNPVVREEGIQGMWELARSKHFTGMNFHYQLVRAVLDSSMKDVMQMTDSPAGLSYSWEEIQRGAALLWNLICKPHTESQLREYKVLEALLSWMAALMTPLRDPSEVQVAGCRTAQLMCLGAVLTLCTINEEALPHLDDVLPKASEFFLQATEQLLPRRGAVTGYDVIHHTVLEVVALQDHVGLHDRLMVDHPELAHMPHYIDRFTGKGPTYHSTFGFRHVIDGKVPVENSRRSWEEDEMGASGVPEDEKPLETMAPPEREPTEEEKLFLDKSVLVAEVLCSFFLEWDDPEQAVKIIEKLGGVQWLMRILDSSIPAWAQTAATLLDLYTRDDFGRDVLRSKSYLGELVIKQCRVFADVDEWGAARMAGSALYVNTMTLLKDDRVKVVHMESLLDVMGANTLSYPGRYAATACMYMIACKPQLHGVLLGLSDKVHVVLNELASSGARDLQHCAAGILCLLAGCNTRALLGAPGQFISMSETAFLGQRLSLHREGYANVLDNLMSRCDHRSVVVELCSAALQYMLSVDRPHVGELQLDLLQRLLQCEAGTCTLQSAAACVWTLVRATDPADDHHHPARVFLLKKGGHLLVRQICDAIERSYAVTQTAAPRHFSATKGLDLEAGTSDRAHKKKLADNVQEVAHSTLSYLLHSAWLLAYHVDQYPTLFALEASPYSLPRPNPAPKPRTRQLAMDPIPPVDPLNPTPEAMEDTPDPVRVLIKVTKGTENGHIHQQRAVETLLTLAVLEPGYLPVLHAARCRRHLEDILKQSYLLLNLRWAASELFVMLLEKSLEDAVPEDPKATKHAFEGPTLEVGTFRKLHCLHDPDTNKIYRVGSDGLHHIGQVPADFRCPGKDVRPCLTEKAMLEQVVALMVLLLHSEEPELRELGVRAMAVVSVKHPKAVGTAGAIAAVVRLMKLPLDHQMQLLVAQALLNLSKEPDNQVLVAKKCTFQLLALNSSPNTSSEVQHCTSCTLHNLKQHKENVTVLYKAELKWTAAVIKYGQQKAGTGEAIPNPHANHHFPAKDMNINNAETIPEECVMDTLLVRAKTLHHTETLKLQRIGALKMNPEDVAIAIGDAVSSEEAAALGGSDDTFDRSNLSTEAALTMNEKTSAAKIKHITLQSESLWQMTTAQLQVLDDKKSFVTLIENFGKVKVQSRSQGAQRDTQYTWLPSKQTSNESVTTTAKDWILDHTRPRDCKPSIPGTPTRGQAHISGLAPPSTPRGSLSNAPQGSKGLSKSVECGTGGLRSRTYREVAASATLPTNGSASANCESSTLDRPQSARLHPAPPPSTSVHCWAHARPSMNGFHQSMRQPFKRLYKEIGRGAADMWRPEISEYRMPDPPVNEASYAGEEVSWDSGMGAFKNPDGTCTYRRITGTEDNILNEPDLEANGIARMGKDSDQSKKKKGKESADEEMHRLVEFYFHDPTRALVEKQARQQLRPGDANHYVPLPNPMPTKPSGGALPIKLSDEQMEHMRDEAEFGRYSDIDPPINQPPLVVVTEQKGPGGYHQEFNFKYGLRAGPAESTSASSRKIDRFGMFQHVEGCEVCEHLYHHYELPTGEKVHCFHKPKLHVDQEIPKWSAPDQSVPRQQTNLGEWNSLLPRVQANLAPDPLLDVDAGRLSVCRPDPPDPWQESVGVDALLDGWVIQFRVEELKEPNPIDNSLPLGEEHWLLNSVFAHRYAQTRALGMPCSETLLDTDEIVSMSFTCDWNRLLRRKKFLYLIGLDLKHLVKAVKELHPQIRCIYTYYSVQMNLTKAFYMAEQEWQLLVDHLQMTTQNCTRRAQYDIYSDIRSTIRYGSMQTSFEADSPETNHDGIVPCHLIEGLVRLAMLRFNPKEARQYTGATGNGITPTECLRLLFKHVVNKKLPWEAYDFDPNDFRLDRLYVDPVHRFGTMNRPLLETAWRCYRGTEDGLSLPQWIKLLQDARLVGENAHTEVSMVDAALCFAWSRPLWPDETRLREMSQKLTFVDFYEALARLADVFSPVPRLELRACNITGKKPTFEYYTKIVTAQDRPPRRHSASFATPKTRPLEEKLGQVAEFLSEVVQPEPKLVRKYAQVIKDLIHAPAPPSGEIYEDSQPLL